VKRGVDAVFRQPGAGLLDGVAVGDAVEFHKCILSGAMPSLEIPCIWVRVFPENKQIHISLSGY
jgi:hypothetical protein